MVVGVDCVSLVGSKFLGQKGRVLLAYVAIPSYRLADILAKGTFGPMASAFSVCALVEDWRVMIPPGGTESNGVEEKDPKWCALIFICRPFCHRHH